MSNRARTIGVSFFLAIAHLFWIPTSQAIPGFPNITIPARSVGNSTQGPALVSNTASVPVFLPTITLTSPQENEVWSAGNQVTVTWTSSGLSADFPVLVFLRKGSDGPGAMAFQMTPSVGEGQCSFAVPNWLGDGTDYAVELWVLDNSSQIVASTQSSPSLTIQGSTTTKGMTLTAPGSGVQWSAGSTQNVTWSSQDLTGTLSSVVFDGLSMISSLTDTPPMTSGVCAWSIPGNIGNSIDYRILVYGEPVDTVFCPFDLSDAFEISNSAPRPTLTITSPNGGESWTAGSTHAVSWTASEGGGSVFLFLQKGTESSYLTSFSGSSGSFSWTISPWQGDADNYRISAQWQTDSGLRIIDTSDNDFAITGSVPPPTLTVTSPNGGETLTAGQTHLITWTSSGLAGKQVTITLYKGSSYGQWLGQVPVEAGQFNWTLSPYVGDGTDYTVRISVNSPYAYDASNAPFAITGSLPTPTLTVTSPNGGETLTAGQTYPITWTSTGIAGTTVDVSLYRGSSYIRSLGQAPVEAGQFAWTPNPYIGDGTDYKIRITVYSPYVYDASDAPFAITGSLPTPTLTVTSPNGGETLTAGQMYPITWTSTGTTGRTVGIYVAKGTENYYRYLGNVPAESGRFDWTISSYIGDGTSYRIRIYLVNDNPEMPSVADTSDADFGITGSLPLPTLTVTSPNGGETLTAGQACSITWNSTNTAGMMADILLVKGTGYYSYLGRVSAEDGHFDGILSHYVGNGTDFKVQIRIYLPNSPEISDISDNPFAITGSLPVPTVTVTSPNGGETLTAGQVHPITWASTGAEGMTVGIYVAKGTDSNYAYLGNVPAESGHFDWAISPYFGDGTDYRIQICLVNDGPGMPYVADTSDADLSITGSLPLPTVTVTAPNGGETLTAGQAYSITWNSTNAAGMMAEILLTKGTGNDYAYLGSVPAEDGHFDWIVSQYVGNGTDFKVRIRIRLSDGTEIVDTSDANLAITGSLPVPTVTVTSPNGGETLTAGQTYPITWTSTGATGMMMQIYLAKGTDNYYAYIGSVLVDDGRFDWTVCPYVGDGTDYRIHLSIGLPGAPYVGDTSDGYLTITGSVPPPTLTVTSPNGGETLTVGQTYPITWTSTEASGLGVSIYLETFNGRYDTLTFLGTVPADAGQFDWTIHPSFGEGTLYKIYLEIWYPGAPTIREQSDSLFTITAPTTASIRGTLDLGQSSNTYLGDLTAIPVEIELRNAGSSTPLRTEMVCLDSTGYYTLSDVAAGTYDVAFRPGSPWLQKVVRNVTVSVPEGATVDAACISGNLNDDNVVNFSDYLVFSLSFGTSGPDGDFNGDGNVNFSDYLIFSQSFGSTGGMNPAIQAAEGEVAAPAESPLAASLPCAPMGLIVLAVLGLGSLAIVRGRE